MKAQKIAAIIIMVMGGLFIATGATTYNMVHTKLVAEKITVTPDSPKYAGKQVAGPLTAFAQADMIAKHALEATGGKTYAELDREDPLRVVAMNGSFLRASLFTSVLAFGVSAFAMGVGLVFIVGGWALLGLVKRQA